MPLVVVESQILNMQFRPTPPLPLSLSLRQTLRRTPKRLRLLPSETA